MPLAFSDIFKIF